MVTALSPIFKKHPVSCGARRAAAAGLVALIALLGGCGSIPDLKPFADATADVQTGVTSLGVDFGASIPEGSACGGGQSCRDRFAEVWKPRAL